MTDYEELVYRISFEAEKFHGPSFSERIRKETFEALGHIDRVNDALADIGRGLDNDVDIQVDVNTNAASAAIAAMRTEIMLLRQQIAETLEFDVDADTRPAERAIRELMTKIKLLTASEGGGIGKGKGGGGGGPGEAAQEEVLGFFARMGRQIAFIAARSGLQFISAIGRAFMSAAPAASSILGPALAVILGVALQAAGGILVGGAGVGVLTAAIISAFQDPAVSAAAGHLVENIKGSFAGMGDGLRGPVLVALEDISIGFAKFAEFVGPAFDRLGPTVEFFGAQLRAGLEFIGPWVADVVDTIGPVIREIAVNLRVLFGIIAVGFKVLSTQSVGAALAIRAMFAVLATILVGLFVAVTAVLLPLTAIGKIAEWVHDKLRDMNAETKKSLLILGPAMGLIALALKAVDDGASDSARGMDLLTRGTDLYNEAVAGATANTNKFNDELERARTEAEATATAMGQVFGQILGREMNFDQTFLSVQQGWHDIGKAVEENGTAFDVNTEAGIANRRALLAQVQAIGAHRDAMIADGKSILDSTGWFLDNLAAIRQQSRDLGINADAVDGLLASYESLPAEALTRIATEFSQAENPVVLRGEMERVLGKEFTVKVLAQPEAGSVAAVMTYFGEQFGDAVAMRTMVKADAEGWQNLQDNLKADAAKAAADAEISVVAVADDTTFGAINTQITTWETSNPEVTLFPLVDGTSLDRVTTQLNALSLSRYPLIVPILDGIAYDRIQRQLANLTPAGEVPSAGTGATGGGGFVTGAGNPEAGNRTITLAFNDEKFDNLVDVSVGEVAAETARTLRRRRVISI